MSSNQYQREIAQLIKDAGSLRVSIGAEETAAGKARAEAARKRAEAAKTTNVSVRRQII